MENNSQVALVFVLFQVRCRCSFCQDILQRHLLVQMIYGRHDSTSHHKSLVPWPSGSRRLYGSVLWQLFIGVCVVTLTALLSVRTMQGALRVLKKKVTIGRGLLRKTLSHPSMEDWQMWWLISPERCWPHSKFSVSKLILLWHWLTII